MQVQGVVEDYQGGKSLAVIAEAVGVTRQSVWGLLHRRGIPMRSRFHHTRLTKRRPIAQRFWAKVAPTEENGCLLWTGALTGPGYGQFGLGRRGAGVALAHVYAWHASGQLIPEGWELDHLCRTRHCVNAWHLAPVTHRTNVLRGKSAPAQNARKGTCPRGHHYDLVMKGGRRGCRECINALQNARYRARVPSA